MNNELTELERLMLKLDDLVRNLRCNSTDFSGLQFKPPYEYLTLDGYPLGSVVWYIFCKIGKRSVFCFGRTPEQAVTHAIELFEAYKRLPEKELNSFIDDFKIRLKSLSETYIRQV